MYAAQLEERYRARIGAPVGVDEVRDSDIRFAVHFARLLAGIVTERDLGENTQRAMRAAIHARTPLLPEEINALIDLALAPESRVAVDEDHLRAFGARFGPEEEEALRQRLANEVDLHGFAELYGEDEALLLLDSLFQVCAVDGQIDRTEIGRLVRAAEQLGIDGMLIGMLFRKHDPRHASGEIAIELDQDRYVIGRAVHLDIPLPDPQIAPQHAELVRTGDGWRVDDLGSGRTTLVDGHSIASSPLAPGGELRLGSYCLTLGPEGRTLRIVGAQGFSSLLVRGLQRRLRSGQILLDKVEFTVFTGEVIAIVGPSGSGKTTLLHALAGIAPADSGAVIYDGEPFGQVLAQDPAILGMVPQDDLIQPELKVEEALRYAGRLRLGQVKGVQAEVDRVIAELDLETCRSTRIGDAVHRGISGGQRKRVNVGQELLTRSTRVLFLDEPTSGLDPQTAQDIVRLVRDLADGGRIVFVVTHDLSPSILSMVDHVMVLATGGRLAWFGPPPEAAAWFGVSSPDEVFAKLSQRSPEDWASSFRDSAAYRKYVRTREHLLGLEDVVLERATPRRRIRPQRRWRQLATLTERYLLTKLRDVGGLAVLLAQAPILGLLMWLVFPAPDPPAMFVMALSSLWFGASASVRELISDRAIWKREARVGVSALSYLGSKVLVLGALVGLQCTVLAGICFEALNMGPGYGFSLPALAGICSLTGWIGMGIGLVIGAFTASSEAAVGALPLVLIPQIMFGGLIVKVKEMGTIAAAFSWLMVVRYSFEAVIKTGHQLTEPLVGGQHERVAKPISGILYNLGFKSSGAVHDVGLPMPILVVVLLSVLLALLLVALFRTWRTGLGR